MMKKALFVVCLAGLAGCAMPQHSTSNVDAAPIPRTELSDSEKAVVEQAVRANLKDPDSAQFTLGPAVDRDVYCGFVNARNSYGGYTGHHQFMVSTIRDGSGIANAALLGIGGSEAETVAVGRMCSRYGY